MPRRRRNSRAAFGWIQPGAPLGAGLLTVCALVQFGLGLYFIVLRPPLLPEDMRYLGLAHASTADLTAWRSWLNLVFTVMGGQMAAVGALAGALALRYRATSPSRGEVALLLAAGLVSAGVMSGVNFALGSDFKWVLLAPPVLWLAAGVSLLRAAQRPD